MSGRVWRVGESIELWWACKVGFARAEVLMSLGNRVCLCVYTNGGSDRHIQWFNKENVEQLLRLKR